MTRIIDLNADMGEYSTRDAQETEASLMSVISSCSIACGGHAGDEETMRATTELAKQHGVSIGAHPAYPDRENFGRRSMAIEKIALARSLHEQIQCLQTIASEQGITLAHIKPHGALYNDAARDVWLATIILNALPEGTPLIGPPNSVLASAAAEKGHPFIAEGFVDRLYLASGVLTPRTQNGAVIDDQDCRNKQARALARGEPFPAADGMLQLDVRTLCIHSDTQGAVATARAVRATLEQDGFQIAAFT